MRGKAVFVLLGITALVAYSAGRQSASVSNAPPVAAATPQSAFANPMAFSDPAMRLPERVATPSPSSGPPPSTRVSLPQSTAPAGADKPSGDIKRKVELALTAAAIAAIIVQASRDQYHAGGRPCACPDDTCEMAELAAAGAPIRGWAGQRRFAILMT